MKIIFLLVSAFSISVMATSLHPDTFVKSFSGFSAAEAELAGVEPLCPEGVTCITNGTVVSLNYVVDCVDEIVAFSYDAVEKDGDLHVYVSAVLGHTPISGPRCLGMSLQTKTISLINQYGNVVLHNLGVQN